MWKDEEQDRTRGRNAGTAATIPIRFPRRNNRRFSKDNHRKRKVRPVPTSEKFMLSIPLPIASLYHTPLNFSSLREHGWL